MFQEPQTECDVQGIAQAVRILSSRKMGGGILIAVKDAIFVKC